MYIYISSVVPSHRPSPMPNFPAHRKARHVSIARHKAWRLIQPENEETRRRNPMVQPQNLETHEDVDSIIRKSGF